MFYQVSARMDSFHTLQRPFKMSVDPYVVLVDAQPDGTVQRLTLRVQALDYAGYLPSFDHSTSPPTITWPANPHDDDLLGMLQHLESLGSFWLGIKRIYWDEAEFRWEPETEDERRQLQLFSIKTSREYPRSSLVINPQYFASLIRSREPQTHLVLPMAFYREGVNDFKSHRYVNAFFNFYFYMEDLYGQGETKNKLVETAFKKSEQLRSAIEQFLQGIIEPDMTSHLHSLESFLQQEHCELTIDGIIALIVKIRGNLHHFSQRSSKMKGHPLNQVQFQTPAYMLFAICVLTATKLLTK